MSEFKGTKEEWKSEPQRGSKNNCFQAQVFCGNQSIAVVDSTEDPSESTANAKLIACAPEMLEKLIDIESFATLKPEYRKSIQELIKKATT